MIQEWHCFPRQTNESKTFAGTPEGAGTAEAANLGGWKSAGCFGTMRREPAYKQSQHQEKKTQGRGIDS